MTFPPSEPPPEDYPEDGRPLGPPPGYPQGPPPGYPPGPPQGYPPGYPPPGYPYYPAPQQKSGISAGLAVLGTLLYIMVNSVLAFAAFIVGAQTSNSDAVFGGAAVMLLLIAFGGGAALLRSKNPNARGLGLGLMIGWAVTSLVTVGFCTGINPELYTT
ncbi:hypothetical protein [Mycobacterium sp. NPDC050041]|uniref:hypothetical protein n=1 Tax=Mycobacterium sp. NPDC050041 TaxID=3364293 RepID=UPI003C2B25EB